jgi:siroheme synthase (precorrin-2 oxidase/ferrochelatase)
MAKETDEHLTSAITKAAEDLPTSNRDSQESNSSSRFDSPPHEVDDVAAMQLKKVTREVEKLELETRLLRRAWWLQAPRSSFGSRV